MLLLLLMQLDGNVRYIYSMAIYLEMRRDLRDNRLKLQQQKKKRKRREETINCLAIIGAIASQQLDEKQKRRKS